MALLLPDTVGFPFPETFADLEVQSHLPFSNISSYILHTLWFGNFFMWKVRMLNHQISNELFSFPCPFHFTSCTCNLLTDYFFSRLYKDFVKRFIFEFFTIGDKSEFQANLEISYLTWYQIKRTKYRRDSIISILYLCILLLKYFSLFV